MGGRHPTAGGRTDAYFRNSPLGGTVVVTVTPLVNDDNVALGRVLVARDVTQQVRLEAEREALRAQLAQSEKLASLGQFVAGIAHEINNPLQGVLGHVELHPAVVRGPGGCATELRRVLHEADRAAKIVRNLLVFSGSRRMTKRRLTRRAGRSRRRSAAGGAHSPSTAIEIVRRQPETPVTIAGDPLLLQQAFLNVLINAEHAIVDSGRRGTIEIAIETTADGASVIARIRDSGPGIDEEVLPRIFDPFFTTKEVGQGDGPRPDDHLRHRPGARRHDHRRQRSRGRRGLHDRASGGAAACPSGASPRSPR